MNEDSPIAKRRFPAWLKTVVKLVIFAAVAAGITRAVWQALDEFREQQFSLAEVDYLWLAAAGAIYVLGLAPAWLFWHQTLRAMQQRPTFWESLRSYYLGHLGKYVPGKAMVVVIRVAQVRSRRTSATVAAASVVVETLTMMAVGALVAAAILAVLYREQLWLLLLAVVLLVAAAIPTIPPVFRRLVRLVQVQRLSPEIDNKLAGLDARLMLTGWAEMVVVWCLLGLSLMATLHAMPGVEVSWDQAPLLVCTTALAMVAGFLSLLPGGIGVRELVVITLLAPAFGEVAAIVSAVLLRFAWLLSEVVVSSILYVGGRFKAESGKQKAEQ